MKTILIVEDHPEVRTLMRMTLEEGGFEVHDAGDAASGWEAVLRLRPDIVLLDIMMPGEMDGLQLCRRIKDDDQTRASKVVLVSARGHRNDMAIGMDAGADDYLLKPFNPFRLLEVIALLTAKP